MPYFIYFLLLVISQEAWAVSAAQDTTIPIPPNMNIEPELQEEETTTGGVFISFHETMPRFPGCEDQQGTDLEKKQCSDQLLIKYIYENLNYPKEAQAKQIEGMAVVSFWVNEQGRLEGFELLRDPGAGTGTEALRIMQSMNQLDPWTPGTQRGKVVKVKYNLPIRFKLQTEQEENQKK